MTRNTSFLLSTGIVLFLVLLHADFQLNRDFLMEWASAASNDSRQQQQGRRALSSLVPSSPPSSLDALKTPAIQCRLDLESWQHANILRWMDTEFPWMEWIWQLEDPLTRRPYYLVMMLTIRTGGGKPIMKAPRLSRLSWTWQDQYGYNHTAKPMFANSRVQPRNDRIYLRLDIPQQNPIHNNHNHDNHNNTNSSTTVHTPKPKYLWPSLPERREGGGDDESPVIRYDLEPYLNCSNLEKHTAINRPKPNTKLGACVTRFWGQHDLLPQWLAYHRLLGVEHFWFFVGEPFDNIRNNSHLPRNETDVTYVPYHYKWARYRHKREGRLQFAAGNNNMFQPAATNHCLYLAKQYGVEWIIAPDLDEYIVLLQDPPNSSSLDKDGLGPLPQYLEYHHNAVFDPTVGQVCLSGVAFGRHPSLEPVNSTRFELSIDFTYRGNRSLPAAGGRPKCFYRTSVVNDAWIHHARDGGRRVNANASQIDLYHYRTPLLGVFNDDRNLFQNTTQLVSYPEVRDRYRHQIVKTLHRYGWSFPNFSAHVDTGHGEYVYRRKNSSTSNDGKTQ